MLLILLGVWGGLIPFVGPHFNLAYTPADSWHYTTGRLYLEILPGAGAIVGGLLTVGSAHRAVATLGGWLAAASGAWFVLGMPLATIWSIPTVGVPTGSTNRQAVEYIAFFGGVGVAIVFFAAFALGRFAVVGVREMELVRRSAAAEESLEMDNEPTAANPPAEPTTAIPTERPDTATGSTPTTGSEPEAGPGSTTPPTAESGSTSSSRSIW